MENNITKQENLKAYILWLIKLFDGIDSILDNFQYRSIICVCPRERLIADLEIFWGPEVIEPYSNRSL